jgi:hypothetical protein
VVGFFAQADVTLANIGESMLQSNSFRDFQHDLKCLGSLLERMLKPESVFADSEALELRQECDDIAADFLKQTHFEPAAALLQVSIETHVVGQS